MSHNLTGEDPGGGIHNTGSLTLIDTTVRKNRADWGGGIAGGVVTIGDAPDDCVGTPAC